MWMPETGRELIEGVPPSPVDLVVRPRSTPGGLLVRDSYHRFPSFRARETSGVGELRWPISGLFQYLPIFCRVGPQTEWFEVQRGEALRKDGGT